MPKYTATFQPEAWVNDYAIPVDPEGETEWDCTAAVLADPDYWQEMARDDYGSGWLDRDDVLKDHHGAPEWVRMWSGPFTIRVHKRMPH